MVTKQANKILALLLAAAMAFTLMPAAAFAAANTGDGYTLGGDGKLVISSDAGMAAWTAYSNSDANRDKKALVKTVSVENGVTGIDDTAFMACGSLAGVTIPGSVTSIGEYAFQGCALTAAAIPDSVTGIGEYAFAACSGLTAVIIPGSVASVGDNAFYGCAALAVVTFEGADPPALGRSAFSGIAAGAAVHVPAGREGAYQQVFADSGHDDFAGQVAVPPITGSMTVGGEAIDDLGVSGSGSGWAWDAAAGALTLTDYTGSGIEIHCGTDDPVKLILDGDSAVAGENAILCDGSLEISGSGTVKAEGLSRGLISHGGLTVRGGVSVTATGSALGISSPSISVSESAKVTAVSDTAAMDGGTVTVSGGTLTVGESGAANGLLQGGLSVTGAAAVTVHGAVSGGLSVTDAAAAVTVYGAVSGGLTVSDGTVTVEDEVQGAVTVTGGAVTVDGRSITPAVSGTMTVGGTSVDISADADGAGWAWTAAAATLTLTDYNGGGIEINCAPGNTVHLALAGNAAVTGGGGDGISCAGSLVIGGGGTLAVTDANTGIYSAGALSASGASVTVTGGTYGIYGGGDIAVSGGTVSATGTDTGIYSYGSVSVSGGANITVSGEAGSGIYGGGDIDISGGSGTVKGANYAVTAGGRLTQSGTIRVRGFDGSGYTVAAAIAGDIGEDLLSTFVNAADEAELLADIQFTLIHTVTFEPDGGTQTGGGAFVQEVAHGGEAVAPELTRDNYRFRGWDKPLTNITSSQTVTALWTRAGGGYDDSADDSGYTAPAGANSYIICNIIRVPYSQTDGAVTSDVAAGTLRGIVDNALIRGDGSRAVKLDYRGVSEASAMTGLTLTLDAAQMRADEDIAFIVETPFGVFIFTAAQTRDWFGGAPGAYTVTLEKSGLRVDVKQNGQSLVWRKLTPMGKIGVLYTLKTGENAADAVVTDAGGRVLPTGAYENGMVYADIFTPGTYEAAAVTPAAFTDITDHWAKTDIDFCVSRGLMSGVSASVFSPDTAVSRADFLLTLGRLAGADAGAYQSGSFTDLPNTSPAMPYIERAVENGVASGAGNSGFGPDAAIPRELTALMMKNYANALGFPLPAANSAAAYADSASVSSWAMDAVTDKQKAGIMIGKDGNRFDPQGNTTRAEAAAIIRRFVEYVMNSRAAEGWSNANHSLTARVYYTKNGAAVTGRQTVDGARYYFDSDGVMRAE